MADENEMDELQEEEKEVADLIIRTTPVPDLPRTRVARIRQRALSRFEHGARSAPAPRQPSYALSRRALALVLAAALVFGSWGVVAASTTSLPGQTLYPVKRLAEEVTLALAPASKQPSLHLEFAGRRLSEIEAVAAQGKVLATLLGDLAEETMLVLAGAPAAPADQQRSLFTRLADLCERELVVLGSLETAAPDEARPALVQALQIAQYVLDRAHEALGTTQATPIASPSATLSLSATPSPSTTPSPPATLSLSATPARTVPPLTQPTDAAQSTPATGGPAATGQQQTPADQSATPPGPQTPSPVATDSAGRTQPPPTQPASTESPPAPPPTQPASTGAPPSPPPPQTEPAPPPSPQPTLAD